MPRLATALMGFVLLAGCAGSPSVASPSPSTAATPAATTATSGTSTSSSSTETPEPVPSVTLKVIEISLKDGRVAPNGERVAVTKGTILQLKITSDHLDKVHVHGYDVEIAVKPGGSVTKEITLDQVGRFEIESHEPAFTILQLVVS